VVVFTTPTLRNQQEKHRHESALLRRPLDHHKKLFETAKIFTHHGFRGFD
jgi:hypothetical protein